MCTKVQVSSPGQIPRYPYDTARGLISNQVKSRNASHASYISGLFWRKTKHKKSLQGRTKPINHSGKIQYNNNTMQYWHASNSFQTTSHDHSPVISAGHRMSWKSVPISAVKNQQFRLILYRIRLSWTSDWLPYFSRGCNAYSTVRILVEHNVTLCVMHILILFSMTRIQALAWNLWQKGCFTASYEKRHLSIW